MTQYSILDSQLMPFLSETFPVTGLWVTWKTGSTEVTMEATTSRMEDMEVTSPLMEVMEAMEAILTTKEATSSRLPPPSFSKQPPS